MADPMWPSAEQTDELLAAARDGNEMAVDALLQRHRDSIRRLVQMRLDRKVRRRVDVSDVVQDVMIEASGRMDKYLADPQMAFHLWLRQIAWDRIIDTYRRHRGSARRSVDREQPLGFAGDEDSSAQLAIQLQDQGATPAAIATRREIAQRVEAAIDRLDEHDREIIIMRHYEHLSNQEAAEALGLHPPAASMRYLRAVRRLREVLQGDSSDTSHSRP